MEEYFLVLTPENKVFCRNQYIELSTRVQQWLRQEKDINALDISCDIIGNFIELLFEQYNEEEENSLSVECFQACAEQYVQGIGFELGKPNLGDTFGDNELLCAYMYFCADRGIESPETLVEKEDDAMSVASKSSANGYMK